MLWAASSSPSPSSLSLSWPALAALMLMPLSLAPALWLSLPLPRPVIMTDCAHDLPCEQLLVGMGAGAVSSVLGWCGCGAAGSHFVVVVVPWGQGHRQYDIAVNERSGGAYLAGTPLHGPPGASRSSSLLSSHRPIIHPASRGSQRWCRGGISG